MNGKHIKFKAITRQHSPVNSENKSQRTVEESKQPTHHPSEVNTTNSKLKSISKSAPNFSLMENSYLPTQPHSSLSTSVSVPLPSPSAETATEAAAAAASHSSPGVSRSKLLDEILDRYDVTVFTDGSGLYGNAAISSFLNSPLLEDVNVRLIRVPPTSLLETQLIERLQGSKPMLPVVFVRGFYLGGNEEIDKIMHTSDVSVLEALLEDETKTNDQHQHHFHRLSRIPSLQESISSTSSEPTLRGL